MTRRIFRGETAPPHPSSGYAATMSHLSDRPPAVRMPPPLAFLKQFCPIQPVMVEGQINCIDKPKLSPTTDQDILESEIPMYSR